MYTIIDEPKRMTRERIFKEFQGKWVFLVNMEGPLFGFFESAVPVIVADKPFEGKETGIYQRLHDENGENSMDLSFLSNEHNVFGFSEVIHDNN